MEQKTINCNTIIWMDGKYIICMCLSHNFGANEINKAHSINKVLFDKQKLGLFITNYFALSGCMLGLGKG